MRRSHVFAAAATAVLGPGAIVRVDERTKAVTRIALGGMPVAVAAGRSSVWALVSPGTGATRLVRVDPRTGRVNVRRRLPGTPASVLETRSGSVGSTAAATRCSYASTLARSRCAASPCSCRGASAA